MQSGLAILPNVNLVQNIGFGMDATHTIKSNRKFPEAGQLTFPLIHLEYMMRDVQADDFTQRTYCKSFLRRIAGKIEHMLKRNL